MATGTVQTLARTTSLRGYVLHGERWDRWTRRRSYGGAFGAPRSHLRGPRRTITRPRGWQLICHSGPSARGRQRRWGWFVSHGLRATAMGRLATAWVPPGLTSPGHRRGRARPASAPCRESPGPSRPRRRAATRQAGAPSGARSARWRVGEAGARDGDVPRSTSLAPCLHHPHVARRVVQQHSLRCPRTLTRARVLLPRTPQQRV